MVVDRFQFSKGTTKTNGVRYARVREDLLKEAEEGVFVVVRWC